MKKTALILAIGASLGANVAVAAPTVYGRVHVSLESVDNEGATLFGPAVEELWELNSNASRLGVKGEFDLDVGGLKALYQAEYEIDVDDGGGAPFSQRNIFAGLAGGFGELTAGKFDTPLKVAEGKVDQFNDLRADIDNLIGGQNRANNIIQYKSPAFAGGLAARVALIPAEGANVDGEAGPEEGLADTKSVSLTWEKDALYLAVAYETDQAARRSVDGIARGDLIRAVATFKPGPFELGALYQTVEDNVAGSNLKDDSVLLSGAWNIDRYKLKAQYGVSKGDVTDEEITLTALGLDYKLAKASRAYLYAANTERDQADIEDKRFGIGLEHRF